MRKSHTIKSLYMSTTDKPSLRANRSRYEVLSSCNDDGRLLFGDQTAYLTKHVVSKGLRSQSSNGRQASSAMGLKNS